jgi:regulator of CtrA degradation
MPNKTSFLNEPQQPVSFGQRLAMSEAFRALFREGMNLVEEAAAYLDGPGRFEAKALSRPDALAYASESMRLTTRLMQIASWLLLQRAVNEGELTQVQATAEKHKVKLSRQELASNPETFRRLPQKLQDLGSQSMRLQERVMHLDRLLYSHVEPGMGRPLGVHLQIERLQQIFQHA